MKNEIKKIVDRISTIKKNIFVGIQKILPIKGNRWMAIGQSFNGLHDVLIFSGKGEDENFAKTIRILRGGLKAAI